MKSETQERYFRRSKLSVRKVRLFLIISNRQLLIKELWKLRARFSWPQSDYEQSEVQNLFTTNICLWKINVAILWNLQQSPITAESSIFVFFFFTVTSSSRNTGLVSKFSVPLTWQFFWHLENYILDHSPDVFVKFKVYFFFNKKKNTNNQFFFNLVTPYWLLRYSVGF